MKKVLIIGGCGYIGSALYLNFKNKYKVDTIDLEWFGNFSNPNNIKADFTELEKEFLDNYDVIIFVAANSSVSLCNDIFDTMDNNVTKFIKLVNRIDKQKFIYASSSCVYVSGAEPKHEFDEVGTPVDGLTLSKTTIDHFIQLTDVEYYGLRFGSVSGWSPNMRLDLMVNAMTLSAKKHKKVNVFNGYAHRPILSVNDLCSAVETIIENKENNRGIYNIASFNSTVSEIGNSIANYMNVSMEDTGKTYTYDFQISSKKFESVFNFEFKDKSVKNIVKHILENKHNNKWSRRDSK